jgi:outer membrane immunogenic protein
MKKVLLSTVALIAFAAPAAAADLAARPYTKAPPVPIPVMYDWSGFYLGINGGWGSSHKCWDSVAPFLIGGEGCHDATGGTVGGQIGYRWQTGTWVFGLEGQGNWADFNGSNASLRFPGFANETRINAFGLFTGQIGYAANNVLFYVKGGAAVTGEQFRIRAIPSGILFATANDDTRWGASVGAGVEFGFAPNWTAGVEYNHLFMQDRTVNFGLGTAAALAADRIQQDVDLVTVRVNYKWGGPVIAKY